MAMPTPRKRRSSTPGRKTPPAPTGEQPAAEKETAATEPTEPTEPAALAGRLVDAVPGLDDAVAARLLPRNAWAGRAPAHVLEAPRPAAAQRAPAAGPARVQAGLVVPAQTRTVDRAVPCDIFFLDVDVKDSSGTVLAVLRRPQGYPSGPLPADPGSFSGTADPRTQVCRVLAPGAGARCARGRGYF